MLRNNRLFIILGCLSGLLLFGGCSTKKNTLTRRIHHNINSHYNVYWNGEKSLKEGDKQLKTAVKDDFSKVLPVYNYGTKSNGMSLNSQMDRALEKTSICVQKHSMKFNNRERVKWIDDAYLVMAKAHFYKQDYIPARRTFDFVATEYKNNDIAYVANMWLIKTYIQTEQYPKAVAMIEQLQTKISGVEKLPKELSRNLDLTIADYFIAVKDYDNAVKYLKTGILENNDRDLRTRAMFILGQIYMTQNDSERAIEQFKRVIKRNPEYEMAFEARMNMAKMGSADNAQELYKMLIKMLNDPNNEDYCDRIYYAMAELALREGDENKAIRYLRESVAAFKNNTIQRSTSALKVASMYFDRNAYELSQAYYDTAVMGLDREFEGYDSIMNISQTLNELVLNMNVVRTQDSLLRVADMDSVTRNALIDKIIAQVIEDEQYEAEQREYEEQLALMGGATGASTAQSDPSQAGAWYFYNQATLTRGYTEFTKKWGMRKLEDNWFLTDKQSLQAAFSGGDEEDEEEMEKKGKAKDSLSKSYTNHDRGYYLTDLPFTPEQKEEANLQIANALYNLGFIYMDRLSDYPRSVESYESLDTRYPGNEKELPSWYALYKINNEDLKDEEKATYYKNKILDKYPTSSYAQVILDPDYFKKLEAQEKESSDFYAKTYEAFQQGQFYRVKMNSERAMEMYEADTAMMPRFAFLNAVARGRLESIDTMAYALYDLIRKYPTSSIKNYATQVLTNINEEYNLGFDLSKISDKEAEQPEVKKAAPYNYEPQSEHFVMIVCDSKLVRVDPLKVRISDFNKRDHHTETFYVKSVILDEQRTVVTIGNFDGEQKAKDYITSMFLTDYVFGGIDSKNYSIAPISSKNYPVFYQSKDFDEYKTFMDDNNK
ncbi:MAG: tetratricopeptide repeat protein [Bacteroidales bacterium]|nr:tetratricopeptide repeat protein [Candidatus Limimorpha equi]MCQ2303915.1 tetratricopeptide repeat protein [Bacteroidales bacterium]